MTEILIRVMNIVNRVRNMQDLNMFAYAVFAVLLVFGIMNCVLGYRLLRFWVMLFGFCIGAIGGALCMYYVDVADKMYYLGAMVIGGLVLGIIAFLSYRLGIFILGAGTGLLLSLYILHPTTSFVFFVCILIGIGLGGLGLKFCREVLIVVTSLAGGVLTGVSAAKLLGLAEVPYGIFISVAAAGLGLLIQFAMNRPEEDDEDEEDVEERRKEAKRRREEEDYFDELAYEEMQREEEAQRQMRRKKVPQINLTEDAGMLEKKVTPEKNVSGKKKTLQVDAEVYMSAEETKVARRKAASQTEATAQMEVTAEEAAWLEERRQMKQRQAVVESVKAEAVATTENSEDKNGRRNRKVKRVDAVVDVKVGE